MRPKCHVMGLRFHFKRMLITGLGQTLNYTNYKQLKSKKFKIPLLVTGVVGSGDTSNYSLGLDRPNLSGTEGELSETGSSIETALDSDMATRGAALSQAELNAQVNNTK